MKRDLENPRRESTSSIQMGEMRVACKGTELRTLLGSCVGLSLYDGRHKVAGLAHIVLPEAHGPTDRPGKFVVTAVPALVSAMQRIVEGELKLSAKLAGGASMFASSAEGTIGERNVEACERVLAELAIPIVARHCGGSQGRRMLVDSSNGRVLIEMVGRDPVEI